jgi:hypothetical protein
VSLTELCREAVKDYTASAMAEKQQPCQGGNRRMRKGVGGRIRARGVDGGVQNR